MLLLFFFLIPSYCGGCYFFLSHSCECLLKVLQFKFLVLYKIVLQNVLILTAFVNNKKELLIHSIYLLLFVIIVCCAKISRVNTSKLRTMLKIIANTFSAYMSVLASVQKPENTF